MKTFEGDHMDINYIKDSVNKVSSACKEAYRFGTTNVWDPESDLFKGDPATYSQLINFVDYATRHGCSRVFDLYDCDSGHAARDDLEQLIIDLSKSSRERKVALAVGILATRGLDPLKRMNSIIRDYWALQAFAMQETA